MLASLGEGHPFTEDYLPGAFSGAVFGYGLARDLSHDQPAAKNCSAHRPWQEVFSCLCQELRH
jgi:hypothetical protein